MADQQKRETVNVGCKMPNGLRLHVMKRRAQPIEALSEAGMPGMAMFEDLGIIELGGHASASPRAPGVPARTHTFTAVDKELFDVWMAENGKGSLVQSGMVFVQESPKDAKPEEPREEHNDEEDRARHEEEERLRREQEEEDSRTGFAAVAPELPAREAEADHE